VKFLARQAIFNPRKDVFAYELLFRSGFENSFPGLNPDLATSSVIDTTFLIGLQKLTAGRLAFVNCPRDFLLGEAIYLLPRDQVVVEILETIIPDEALVAACQRLKKEKYLLALDDFVEGPAWEPLIPLVDFIKVDFRATPPDRQQALAQRHGFRGVRMLAEKVETLQEFNAAKDMGYTLFQGYFFCQPEVIQQHAIPSSKLGYIELLQASLQPEFDFEDLASKIKHEPSLTFRLLRYLNSVTFGLRTEIHSVEHGLALLGERELRKWIAVVCVAVLGDDKPDELMTMPLIRGRFCELLAPVTGKSSNSNDYFLLGLLSVMDALLDQPLHSILSELPVQNEIKDALLAQRGAYRDVLELAVAQERADWKGLTELAKKLHIEEKKLPDLYVSAVEWGTALRESTSAAPTR
jgi:c-di-GMP-related signal transduction protein